MTEKKESDKWYTWLVEVLKLHFIFCLQRGVFVDYSDILSVYVHCLLFPFYHYAQEKKKM